MYEKIDPKLMHNVETQQDGNKNIECIVYANNYNYTKNFLYENFSESDIYEYPFISAFGISADYFAITKLARLDVVNYITISTQVTTLINIGKKVLNFDNISPQLLKNPKFTVAVIDTGISSVMDLSMPYNRIIGFKDFIGDKEKNYDDNGHGTFVSSVLAGNGLVSGGKYSGINPNVFLVGVKALDANGETGAFTILQAMQWVYDNRKKYNIKVVCMSFGSNTVGKRDPLLVGAEVLWNSGVTVVSAAGNSGPEAETIKAPGASSKIITVGALNDNRSEDGKTDIEKYQIANFSSRGPILGNYKPDLIAPGVNIISASAYSTTKEHYKKMSGTSVATPMIAGICSVMLEKNIYLTPNEIKSILIRNCKEINNDRNSEGWGLLNASFLK